MRAYEVDHHVPIAVPQLFTVRTSKSCGYVHQPTTYTTTSPRSNCVCTYLSDRGRMVSRPNRVPSANPSPRTGTAHHVGPTFPPVGELAWDRPRRMWHDSCPVPVAHQPLD